MFYKYGNDQGAFKQAILLSLLAHILLFLVIPINKILQSPIIKKPEKLVELSFTKIPPRNEKKQIISETKAPEKTPPPETLKLAERDAATEVEQIKKGEDQDQPEIKKVNPVSAKPAPQEKPAPQKLKVEKPLEKTENKNSEKLEKVSPKNSKPKIDTIDPLSPTLKLSDGETLAALSNRQNPPKPKQVTPGVDNERMQRLQEYEPFRRGGSSDYLPSVREGDLTLLNAKADRYAVFVKRVALQIFGRLRGTSWSEFPGAEISRVRGFTTLTLTLNQDGTFASLEDETASGSAHYDSIVRGAAKFGGWDQNPPDGARGPDGKIRFTIKSKIWGVASGPMEQRWILLGIGLQ
jgi:hypothetical protein